MHPITRREMLRSAAPAIAATAIVTLVPLACPAAELERKRTRLRMALHAFDRETRFAERLAEQLDSIPAIRSTEDRREQAMRNYEAALDRARQASCEVDEAAFAILPGAEAVISKHGLHVTVPNDGDHFDGRRIRIELDKTIVLN
jgi:hypothetical protein